MHIEKDVKLDYGDVMMLPQCNSEGPNSRGEVILRNQEGILPIIAANMDGVGTFEMAIELAKLGMLTAVHKHYTLEQLLDFFSLPMMNSHAIYSMGANDADYAKFLKFITAYEGNLPMFCVDVANGYTKQAADFISEVKKHGVWVMAGNVVTEDGVFHLANAGADIVKVGIGPGSVCTTRKLTGVGYPQFSAVLECVSAAKLFGHYGTRNPKGLRSPKIVADGGCTTPGDVAKAFAAGADYVMLGGMLAGHDEGGGEVAGTSMKLGGPEYRKFYGMASKIAQEKHNGGVAEYRASEGKEVLVPYRGPVRNTIYEILGGLRSSCAYQGVSKLTDLAIEPKFIRVNNQLNNVFGS
jgi:GMP reductase